MGELGNRISNTIAVALLTVAIVVACWNVLKREAEELDPDKMIITVSHTLLDAGLREALEELASDFEAIQAERGKEVDIRMIDVPERAYRQWARTQLIGGTAPHVIYTSQSNSQEVDTVLTSRYLMPISDLVEEPNPYNEGTPLEGVPWRHTFLDGMNVSGFNFRLTEHFGVPLSATTTRLFVNRDMMERVLAYEGNREIREILDTKELSRMTAREFFALCEAVQAYAEAKGLQVVPIAGSRTNAQQLMDDLFSAVTQKLYLKWDKIKAGFVYPGTLMPPMARGEFGLDSDAFRAGFALMRKVALFMQPGFYQMARDDATFYFAQEKAMMIVASSWDAASFRELIGDRFEMLIAPIPTPGPDDPVYGRFVLGPISEGNVAPRGTFSFVNYHPEEEIEMAIEFMQFLTSYEGNAKFSRLSGWLPSVVGVEPSPITEPFMPVMDGYPSGFNYALNKGELRRVVETHFHLLFDREGSVEEFYEELMPALKPVIWEEVLDQYKEDRRNAARQDSMMGGHIWLSLHGNQASAEKLGGMIDHMAEVEDRNVRLYAEIEELKEERR